MLRSRITPCLLVHKKGLVKTVEFDNPKYVGDPINAVKIFNEKEVGGITSVDQAKKIISLGVEKIAISSAALSNTQLLKDIGNAIGKQSLVVVLDVKKKGLFGNYELYTHNGKKSSKYKLKEYLTILNEIGIGEIVVNSIDEDGKMKGYDFKLYDIVRDFTSMPMTILGGAGSLDDIRVAIERYKTIGVSAGSLFVFKGKYKAVLINYPDRATRNEMYY